MSKKQTSIEWLESTIKSILVDNVSTIRYKEMILALVSQAKAMHKEEIIKAYKNAMASAYFNTHNWAPQEGYIHKAEQYYTETYGK